MMLLSYLILQSLWLLGQADLEDNPGITESIPHMMNYGLALQKAAELQASILKSSEEPMVGPTGMTPKTHQLIIKCLECQNDLHAKLIKEKIGQTTSKDHFSEAT